MRAAYDPFWDDQQQDLARRLRAAEGMARQQRWHGVGAATLTDVLADAHTDLLLMLGVALATPRGVGLRRLLIYWEMDQVSRVWLRPSTHTDRDTVITTIESWQDRIEDLRRR